MAELSGFFPSTIANPRKYGSDWLNKLFDAVISDGVFATPEGTPSSYLQVVANAGLIVTIKAGWGRFKAGDETFFYQNETDITKSLVGASGVSRVDYVVVRVDRNESVKRVYVDVKTGDQLTGAEPTLTSTSYVREYLLAKVYIAPNTTIITPDMIVDWRGRTECPWAVPVVKQVDVSTLMEQFATKFWGWYDNVTQNVSGTIMVTQSHGQYFSQIENQSVIEIPSSARYQTGDMLTVYVEGRRFTENVDYTFNEDYSAIVMTNPLPIVGTEIEFENLKNVDASEVTPYVNRLVDVENKLDATKLTDDVGTFKINIASDLLGELQVLPIGMHTFYSQPNNANNPSTGRPFRGIFHKTDSIYGWVIAFSNVGDVFVNYQTGETTWAGWRCIYEVTPGLLWKSAGITMSASHTINPTKKLSQCRNGWVIVWAGYVNGEAIDDRCSVQVIPKLGATGTIQNGQLFYHAIPSPITTTQNSSMTAKAVYISDDKITGSSANANGDSSGYVLRAVYEY